MIHTCLIACLLAADPLPAAEGFSGIWYMMQPTKDAFGYKYSGGFATYPQQQLPIAIHVPSQRKTFFVYGGATPDRPANLLHMVSYFDHAAGLLARPRMLLDKQTNDAHDNPVLSIDDAGHLHVFSNAHGVSRAAYIHRSVRPYDISEFQRVHEGNFSYGQPWHLPGRGFVFVHTRYVSGKRFLHVMTSDDGKTWSEPRRLAEVERGHYAISNVRGGTIALAFDFHPPAGGLDSRTNLYFMQSDDAGATWKNIRGRPLDLPLKDVDNPALAVEYHSRKRLVYLKDMGFDEKNRPVIHYLTSGGHQPGPRNDPRLYTIAHWTGDQWRTREMFPTDHNYDHSSLYPEAPDAWRWIGVDRPGPQPGCTGGEIGMWISRDQGANWKRAAELTRDSNYNHTYPRRPVDADPGFYALWADGNALKSEGGSRLYFCDKSGKVFRMPEKFEGDFATPQPVR